MVKKKRSVLQMNTFYLHWGNTEIVIVIFTAKKFLIGSRHTNRNT